MDTDQSNIQTIDRDYVKSYCASYTNNILDTAFKEGPVLTGGDLKKLCNPDQINFNLLKAIFLQWEAEVNKFQSPYFDHEAPAVQNALKTYMDVLSRHIKLDKGSLRPLLQEAVEETIYQVFTPGYFYQNFVWPIEATSMRTEELFKQKRFLKINSAFYDELIQPWKENNKTEITSIEFRRRLGTLIDTWEQWEDTEAYSQAFSKVVALNTNNLWMKPSTAEEEDEEEGTNNVNQQFAKKVVSLNETLQKEQTTLVDELTKKVEKIDNLKTGLSLNQKFMFVNELYGGSSEEFELVIDKLDQCQNYHEAMKQLDSLSSLRNEWDMDNVVVQELFDLVSKRFSEPKPASDGRPSSVK